MSSDFSEFRRKVKTRQIATDYSWRRDGGQEPTEPVGSGQIVWEGLSWNLSEASACKFYDGYFPLHSHRRILGPVIVFFKKAFRKLLKVFLGWYLFPIFTQQNRFNETILNTAFLERDVLLAIDAKISYLQSQNKMLQEQLAGLRSENGLQAKASADLIEKDAEIGEHLRKNRKPANG